MQHHKNLHNEERYRINGWILATISGQKWQQCVNAWGETRQTKLYSNLKDWQRLNQKKKLLYVRSLKAYSRREWIVFRTEIDYFSDISSATDF